jgi:hypothetical protein
VIGIETSICNAGVVGGETERDMSMTKDYGVQNGHRDVECSQTIERKRKPDWEKQKLWGKKQRFTSQEFYCKERKACLRVHCLALFFVLSL